MVNRKITLTVAVEVTRYRDHAGEAPENTAGNRRRQGHLLRIVQFKVFARCEEGLVWLVETDGHQERFVAPLAELDNTPIGDLAIRVVGFGTVGGPPVEGIPP